MADLAGLAATTPRQRSRWLGGEWLECKRAIASTLVEREQDELLAATGEWRSLNYTITPDGPLHHSAHGRRPYPLLRENCAHMPLVCSHQTLGKRRYGAAVVKSLAGEENGDIMSGGEH